MKFSLNRLNRSVRILVFTFVLLAGALSARSQCKEVDLQAVSIDPALPRIGKGQVTTLTVVMKNNSDCPIPVEDATVQITFSAVHLELGNPVNFRDECGQWTYLGAVSNAKLHNLFFMNKGGAIPPGDKTCSFHFDVKGKNASPNPVPVTLASSLAPEAKTGDINGSNQSAATELYVTSTPEPVKELVTAFSATTSECDALLSWKAENAAIQRIDVEYGAGEAELVVVGEAAPGTSSFTHYQGNGKKYYRLKITGKNGMVSHSKAIAVETKCVVKKGFAP